MLDLSPSAASGWDDTSNETPYVDVSIAIKSGASMAEPIFNSEPQNFEGWFRSAQSFKIDRIHKIFNLKSSIFNSGLSGLGVIKHAVA